MKKTNRIWVYSGSDLETVEIEKILEHEDETCLSVSTIQNISLQSVPFQIQSSLKRTSAEKDVYVLGIIDSPYNEIKSNENQSKLEQVLDILGKKPTIDQQFISSYAKNGEQGIYNFANILEISNDQVAEIIKYIKWRDRQAQGITILQEAQSIKAIENAKEKGNFVILQIPHNKIRTVLDRVKSENIAIICPEGETFIKAKMPYIDLLSNKFGNNKELRKNGEFRNIGKQGEIIQILNDREKEESAQRF